MADPGYVDLPATDHFTFEYNKSWDASMATRIGTMLMETAERDYTNIRDWFGNLTLNLPFKVRIEQVATGTGLDAYASNDGRQNIWLNLGLKINDPINVDRAREVLVAEFIEIFMVAQNQGWVPGYSHGEALSRFAAFNIYRDVAPYWGGPNVWLDCVSNGSFKTRPDWVNNTDHNDRNPISHGCGLLFLYYLNSQLGYSPAAIASAGTATLASVYERLTSRGGAFEDFTALLVTRYPENTASGLVGSENPFPIFFPPPPPPPPKPFTCAQCREEIINLRSKPDKTQQDLDTLIAYESAYNAQCVSEGDWHHPKNPHKPVILQ